MTDNDILIWCHTLGTTDAERTTVIRDLVAHAKRDRMSVGDKIVCQRAIELIFENPTPDPKHRPSYIEDADIDWAKLDAEPVYAHVIR